VEQPDTGGQRGPAMMVSPDLDRWRTDATVPGVFVWLSRAGGARTTPVEFIAGRPHADCTVAPMRTSRQAGIDWVIVEHSACSDGRGRLTEAAGTGPGDAGLVYVQIAPPVGSVPTYVDTLLAGVRVR
jgi:eukaryotic-like serine/threonine-protein kinase